MCFNYNVYVLGKDGRRMFGVSRLGRLILSLKSH